MKIIVAVLSELLLVSFVQSNSVIDTSKHDTQETLNSDRNCFNQAMSDEEIRDQVHRDKDVKQNIKDSCRSFRVYQQLAWMEAARKIVEIYTHGLGHSEKNKR